MSHEKIIYDKGDYRIREYTEFSFSDGKEYKYYHVFYREKNRFLWIKWDTWLVCGVEKVYFFWVVDIPHEFNTLTKAKNYVKYREKWDGKHVSKEIQKAIKELRSIKKTSKK